MSVRRKARLEAFDACIRIAEQARLDRPEKPRGSNRRRCGDVIRWKENNETIDQICSGIRARMRKEMPMTFKEMHRLTKHLGGDH